MSMFSTIYRLLFGDRPQPRLPPFHQRVNRVDAYRSLLVFHDPSTGAKPHPTQIHTLPIRTHVSSSYLEQHSLFYDVNMAQTHAYYEEIDTISAAALGCLSFFSDSKHWHVIHPMHRLEMREWTVYVLWELKKWIEVTQEFFVGDQQQVLHFKEKRWETLEEVRKELFRRGVKTVGDVEGYLGRWEMAEEEGEEEGEVSSSGIEDIGGVVRLKHATEIPKEERTPERPPHTRTMTGIDHLDENLRKMVDNINQLKTKGEI